MAGSLNEVKLIGNLGADPEIRKTQDGRSIANLRLATSDSWTDKNTGEKKSRTEWHRVVIFGKVAEIAEKYLRKGSKVYVCGSLQTRKWVDQNQQERYSTEVVLQPFNGDLILLDRPNNNSGAASRDEDFGSSTRTSVPTNAADMDDEIPF